MRTVYLSLVSALTLSCTISHAQDWHLQPVGLQTRWAAQVSPGNALPEYPRPQMVREQWENLNGLWSYAITANTASAPGQFDGKILVPYPLESALSGVKKSLLPDQLLWYQRTFEYFPHSDGHRTLLHFGAVDWQATVYINGREIGTHKGGYESFTFDITDALRSGENELRIKVYDPTDQGPNPHGKQTLNPGGIMYTPTSGIWQTVWLESVPAAHIENLVLTPKVDAATLHLTVNRAGSGEGYTYSVIARSSGKIVARKSFGRVADLPLPHAHLWSPDDPYLYDLEVRLMKGGRVIDAVKSYFGMRKIEVRKDDKGVERIFLNNKVTFNLGTLDQGFWPDGLYTAPADEALKFDIQAMKAMGFNTIRKHIKVEPDRWYYWCDKLGMLVWQDMVNPGNDAPEGREEFEQEARATVEQLRNHPSITTWVLFNEGWGAYDQSRLTVWLKHLDPSRLVDGHTGEERFPGSPEDVTKKWPHSDLTDIHPYPGPDIPPSLPGKARVIGEFGGLGMVVDGHVWNDLTASGSPYLNVPRSQFAASYRGLIAKVKQYESQGLSGAIYTQPYDVEGEQNGLMTYDREVVKIPLTELQGIHASLVPTAGGAVTAASAVSIKDADLRSEPDRYAELRRRYGEGDRDAADLRELALDARRNLDLEDLSTYLKDYISVAPQPYTKSTWALIVTGTTLPSDPGFELMRSQAATVDSVLGPDTAEKVVRTATERTAVSPPESGHKTAGGAPSAQPEFSGAWKLDQHVVLSGPDYANGLPQTIGVTQLGDAITLEREYPVYPPQDGRRDRYAEALGFDGRTAERETFGKRKARATIRRADEPRTLTETIDFSTPKDHEKSDFKRTDTLRLSSDQHMLTITTTNEYPADATKNWSMKGVYFRSGAVNE